MARAKRAMVRARKARGGLARFSPPPSKSKIGGGARGRGDRGKAPIRFNAPDTMKLNDAKTSLVSASFRGELQMRGAKWSVMVNR